MLDTYLQTLDMSSALAEKTRYESRQAALREYERKQSELKAIPAPIVSEPDEIPTDCVPTDYFNTFPEEEKPVETVHDVKMVFYNTTAEFRAAMKQLTEEFGIDYAGLN